MSSHVHAACDKAAPQASPSGEASAHPRLVLATCILASSLAVFHGAMLFAAVAAAASSLTAFTLIGGEARGAGRG